MSEELNTRVRMMVRGTNLQSVPVDDTLSIEGQAADAAAVGAALAQKADLSQVTGISVNGQSADNQGKILIDGSDIPVSDSDTRKLDTVVAGLEARTAADIPISSESGAQSVAQVIANSVNRDASLIPMSSTDETTVKEAMEEAQEDIGDLQTAVEAIQGWTAENVPYTTGESAPSVKDKLDDLGTAVGAIEAWDSDDIKYDAEGEDSIKDVLDDLLDGRVKTVNGNAADENGDVEISTVPYADDLTTEDNVQIDAPFIVRTSGGAASIKSGHAWVRQLKGNSVHTGYVAEVLEMSTDLMEGSLITVELDKETFRGYVESSGVIAMIYSTAWKIGADTVDPADYGITVTGTPEAGDTITITYVKEERGTITPADPDALVATGWNLYDNSAGYARVAAYGGMYKVGGAYNTIRFATDPTGESSAVTVDSSGLFEVEEDGYILLTGGNSTTTYIICCWSDWLDGYSGSFQAYQESEIDLSTIMASLPYGLCSVGNVYDEINFNSHQIIQRVKRLSYTEEAREDAEESGLQYDFDEDYIYMEMTAEEIAAETSTFSLENQYDMDEHGLEFFTGTTEPVGSVVAYGTSLKDKLRRDVATLSQQSLSSAQKKQVRDNIGAAAASDVTAINNALNGLFVKKRFSYSTSVSANAALIITKTQLGITTPSGYTVFGIVAVDLGSKYLAMSRYNADYNNVIYLYNPTSTARDITISVDVMFIRSGNYKK